MWSNCKFIWCTVKLLWLPFIFAALPHLFSATLLIKDQHTLFLLQIVFSSETSHHYISFTNYHIKSPIYICFCFKLFKIWKFGNFNKPSYPVILLKIRFATVFCQDSIHYVSNVWIDRFITFTRCSQETLLDKADR